MTDSFPIRTGPPKTGAKKAGEVGTITEDLFYRGEFSALQPSKQGHRSGSDALLIAASLPKDAEGKLADLGAGAGVAGLAAICANPGLRATLVEKNPDMADIANRSLKLSSNMKLIGRARVLVADVTATGKNRLAAGLENDSFDYAIMNPPYNHDSMRASPDALRAEAHMMGLLGLDAWMRTAAAILKPGGMLAMIYRTEKLGEVLACCQGRFGELRIVPVHSRSNEAAGRVVFRMKKGSKAPLAIMPGLTMHDDDGKPSPTAAALMNGERRVSFD